MSDWNFGSLDLSNVKQDEGIRRLEPGEHDVTCKDARVEPVGDTANRKLVAEFEANDGSGTIRHNFNIHHTNQQAQEIGLRQLKTFLVSANHPNPDQPKDVETMKGLTCKVYVGMGKPWRDRNGVERQNSEIKRFMPVNSQAGSTEGSEKKDFDDAIPF
jgi:hypothetical protein